MPGINYSIIDDISFGYRPDPDPTPKRTFTSGPAWRNNGKYISWRSTLEKNKSFGKLDIFTIQKGNPKNPAILMIHGYPTSSFDFFELFELLSNDYYVCALDTPGYGLSDKPRDGYVYSIEDDARLVDFYIRDILKLNSLALYTHDKGDSVGLALLKLYTQQDEYKITHHFITNGNIYLPLANLKTYTAASFE